MTTTTIPNINRGGDREILCKHCKWIASTWRTGEAGPPTDECRHCKDATPEERAARKKLVDDEGAKFGAKVKADPRSYAKESAELAKVLA